MTRRFFEDAGIAPRMRVLDLGSGAGDVCMMLAEMVGATGSVIGLELDADAVKFAHERVSARAFGNITFVHSAVFRGEDKRSILHVHVNAVSDVCLHLNLCLAAAASRFTISARRSFVSFAAAM
jgi:tRNA A58 N-methylase Trm61